MREPVLESHCIGVCPWWLCREVSSHRCWLLVLLVNEGRVPMVVPSRGIVASALVIGFVGEEEQHMGISWPPEYASSMSGGL